jgi:hypothetical protein
VSPKTILAACLAIGTVSSSILMTTALDARQLTAATNLSPTWRHTPSHTPDWCRMHRCTRAISRIPSLQQPRSRRR